MTKHSKTLLVGNPTARTGKAKRAIESAMAYLKKAGLNPEFFSTLPEGRTVAALADRLEAVDDVARVAYLGGDGTFAESAKGIILARERTGENHPLAMLPMGTANDQGRSFGIQAGEKALEANIDIIKEGVEGWLDVGRVEALDTHGEVIGQDLWFDNAGFGLSARILAQRNRDIEKVKRFPILQKFYRDQALYVGAAFNTFFRTFASGMRFACEVKVDGEVFEWTDCTDLVINGTVLFGGEWIFSENSRPDDGKFEVLPFFGHADWARATLQNHKHNPITDDDREQMGITSRTVKQGREIEVRLFRPDSVEFLPAQIDGEEFVSCDHYRVENLFHHLRIIVPEGHSWV